MTPAELVARYGSPLWLADLERARSNLDGVRAAWARAWPTVRVAYSYKTNRLLALVRALDRAGAAPEVACEVEYRLAREIVEARGPAIVVNGPAKPDSLLARAAHDGALVIADSGEEIERIAAAGGRRVGLRVALESYGSAGSRFGIPADRIEHVAQRARGAGLTVEALAAHLVSTDFRRAPEAGESLAAAIVVTWPNPPDLLARAAGTLAALARRLRAAGSPIVTLDLGGGFPGPPDVTAYVGAAAAELRREGFEGEVLVEPGRALVHDAVDLACTVVAVKTLADGRPCAVLDAGTNILPATLWHWPRIALLEPGRGAERPTLLTGPLCLNVDVLHPAASLPPLGPGDVLLAREVGAYQQVQSTQFGDLRPAVVVRERGRWRLARRRERLADLVAGEPADMDGFADPGPVLAPAETMTVRDTLVP